MIALDTEQRDRQLGEILFQLIITFIPIKIDTCVTENNHHIIGRSPALGAEFLDTAKLAVGVTGQKNHSLSPYT